MITLRCAHIKTCINTLPIKVKYKVVWYLRYLWKFKHCNCCDQTVDNFIIIWLQELHQFFPYLLSNIFGFDHFGGWGLCTFNKTLHSDFPQVLQFLSPDGEIFQLIAKLDAGNFIYEFPIKCLPVSLTRKTHKHVKITENVVLFSLVSYVHSCLARKHSLKVSFHHFTPTKFNYHTLLTMLLPTSFSVSWLPTCLLPPFVQTECVCVLIMIWQQTLPSFVAKLIIFLDLFLAAFEYYLFHFAYFLVNIHSDQVGSSLDVNKDTHFSECLHYLQWFRMNFNISDCLYANLLDIYLCHFLPFTGSIPGPFASSQIHGSPHHYPGYTPGSSGSNFYCQ